MRTSRLGLAMATVIGLFLMALFAMSAMAAPLGAGDPVKGRYIMAADGGCGCHGPDHAGYKPGAPPEQSGEIFQGPFGTVPAPNITPDKDTGIGDWTDAQIINAIRNGIDDEGKPLFPIMPYTSFHFMSDADVTDLVAYLRTLPSVSNVVPDRDLKGPVPPIPQLPPSPATSPTGGIERGHYLATAVSICGDCHTPMLPNGAPNLNKFMAGGLVETNIAANITPDKVTGVGNWSDGALVAAIKQGLEPEGTEVSGLMRDQVVGTLGPGGYGALTYADVNDIVAFLRSIPAVSNVPASGAGFTGGFKALSDTIPEIVGLPMENEHRVANGDVLQVTTGGLLVWHPATNTTAFTDGARTWMVTPSGLEERPNTP